MKKCQRCKGIWKVTAYKSTTISRWTSHILWWGTRFSTVALGQVFILISEGEAIDSEGCRICSTPKFRPAIWFHADIMIQGFVKYWPQVAKDSASDDTEECQWWSLSQERSEVCFVVVISRDAQLEQTKINNQDPLRYFCNTPIWHR